MKVKQVLELYRKRCHSGAFLAYEELQKSSPVALNVLRCLNEHGDSLSLLEIRKKIHRAQSQISIVLKIYHEVGIVTRCQSGRYIHYALTDMGRLIISAEKEWLRSTDSKKTVSILHSEQMAGYNDKS